MTKQTCVCFEKLKRQYSTKDCLPEGSYVYSNNKYIPIEELQQNTQFIENHKYINITSTNVTSEELISINFSNTSLLLTKDHILYTYSRLDNKIHLKYAEDLTIEDYLIIEFDKTIENNLPQLEGYTKDFLIYDLGRYVAYSNPDLSLDLKQYYKQLYDKTLNDCILRLNYSLQSKFLKGLLEEHNSFSTFNLDLAVQIYNIALRCGVLPKIKVNKLNYTISFTKKDLQKLHNNIRNPYSFYTMEISTITKENYSGKLYSIETDVEYFLTFANIKLMGAVND